jgi:hypothetical protein
LVKLLHGGSTDLDMLVWMSRVSLELIGQAGIGVSFDTLAEASPPSEYMLAAKQLMYVFVLFCFLAFAITVQKSDGRNQTSFVPSPRIYETHTFYCEDRPSEVPCVPGQDRTTSQYPKAEGDHLFSLRYEQKNISRKGTGNCTGR